MATDENILITMADALRDLPAIVESSADVVGQVMFDTIAETASQHMTAEGGRWPATQDFKLPLQNAVSHIQTQTAHKVARLVVRGHYALHDLGRANGGIVRSILPVRENGRVNKAVVVAVERRLLARVDRVQ